MKFEGQQIDSILSVFERHGLSFDFHDDRANLFLNDLLLEMLRNLNNEQVDEMWANL